MGIFGRIFVPVDGSPPSNEACAFAVRLAVEWSSELTFAHVVDADRLVCAEVPGLDVGAILHSAADDGRRLLERAAATATAAGVPARTELREGRIVDTLLELAAAQQADLVTLGSHGRTGFRRLMMGSVTEALLRVCPLPVLVVHAQEPAPARVAEAAPRAELRAALQDQRT